VFVCRSQAALQKAVASAAHNARSRQGSTAAGDDSNTDDVFAPRDASRSRANSRWQQQQQQAAAANKRCNSLFGFLNYTSTSCGARLLRTNLLQPLTDINTLQLRLDSLQVPEAPGRAGINVPGSRLVPCTAHCQQLALSVHVSDSGFEDLNKLAQETDFLVSDDGHLACCCGSVPGPP
jgi:hypothetical protein